MKKIYQKRLSLLWIILGFSNAVWAVTLPQQSYSVYNSLYEINNDNVSAAHGTVFKGINHVLKASNDEWGNFCEEQSGGDKMGCRSCCGDFLEALPKDKQADHNDMYQNCLSICNTGLPLGGAPLDLPVWFVLPLCGLYGVLQRVRSKKLEK
jgi:hypothetical protein